MRPVYGALILEKRRLASLRTVVRTSPGRYGHAIVEQGQAVVLSGSRLAVPLSRQSAAWRAEFTTPGILPLRRKGGT